MSEENGIKNDELVCAREEILCFKRRLAEGAGIEPLLPSRRGRIGRPPDVHREVLGGISWVARTACSWRKMTEEYGDFTTAYKQWRAWKERGLWQRILRAQGWKELPGQATRPRK